MRALAALLAAAAAFMFAAAHAVEFRALAPEEGAAVLIARDEFMSELSPADLSIRLRRPEGGNMEDLRALYASSTRAWTQEERARLDAMAARNRERVDLVAAWLPQEVGFIKTTTDVEGGLPHTRGAAIVFGDDLPGEDAALDSLFLHELFHVLSRRNARRHDELYALIGFAACTSVRLSGDLARRHITNPDAPVDRHVAPMLAGDRFVLPRLMSNSDRFDPTRSAFLSYFDLRFVAMERNARGRCRMVRDGGATVFLDEALARATLISRAGRNTGYFLHPEEVLADNFAQLMLGRTDIPDPWVHERLAAWLGLPNPPPLAQ